MLGHAQTGQLWLRRDQREMGTQSAVCGSAVWPDVSLCLHGAELDLATATAAGGRKPVEQRTGDRRPLTVPCQTLAAGIELELLPVARVAQLFRLQLKVALAAEQRQRLGAYGTPVALQLLQLAGLAGLRGLPEGLCTQPGHIVQRALIDAGKEALVRAAPIQLERLRLPAQTLQCLAQRHIEIRLLCARRTRVNGPLQIGQGAGIVAPELLERQAKVQLRLWITRPALECLSCHLLQPNQATRKQELGWI